jgi:hypothetical protein
MPTPALKVLSISELFESHTDMVGQVPKATPFLQPDRNRFFRTRECRSFYRQRLKPPAPKSQVHLSGLKRLQQFLGVHFSGLVGSAAGGFNLWRYTSHQKPEFAGAVGRRVGLAFILCLLTAACAQPSAPAAQAVTTLTPAVDAAPTLTPLPPNINPLTGLAVADPAALARNPMIVKISNAPPLVRPQAGIGAADVVYEHYVEGGLTRFSAVFYGEAPTRVGSIRSARLIDYELIPIYQGLLAYAGASDGVLGRLQGSEFWPRTYMGIRYGQPYYWRDETIDAPHNLFLNTEALWGLAASEGVSGQPSIQGMAFSETSPAGSTGTASRIDLRYRATRAVWEYDRDTARYRRFSDGQPHYDANTMQQVTASNVIILYANHRLTEIVESQWQGAVSYSIEIELWFEGDAVVFRDGQMYEAHWQRPTRESLLTFHIRDGAPFPLKPGNTWVQVFPLPEQQDVTEELLAIQP